MSTITWVTAKGDLGTIPESQFFSLRFEATEISDQTLTYSFISGELPGGMYVTTAGELRGAPTILSSVDQVKKYAFTVRASNPDGLVADRAFSLTVSNTVGPVITPRPDLVGAFFDGEFLSYQFASTNDNPSATVYWSIIDGDLPPGTTFSSTGLLSGYVDIIAANIDDLGFEAAGVEGVIFDALPESTDRSYNFTVQVTDGAKFNTLNCRALIVSKANFTADNDITIINNTFITIGDNNAAKIFAYEYFTPGHFQDAFFDMNNLQHTANVALRYFDVETQTNIADDVSKNVSSIDNVISYLLPLRTMDTAANTEDTANRYDSTKQHARIGWVYNELVRKSFNTTKAAIAEITSWRPVPPQLYVDVSDVTGFTASDELVKQARTRGDYIYNLTEADYDNRNLPGAMIHVMANYFAKASVENNSASGHNKNKEADLITLLDLHPVETLRAFKMMNQNIDTSSATLFSLENNSGSSYTISSTNDNDKLVTNILQALVHFGKPTSYFTTIGANAKLAIDAYETEVEKWATDMGNSMGVFGDDADVFSMVQHLGYWVPYLSQYSPAEIAEEAANDDDIQNISDGARALMLGLLLAATRGTLTSSRASDAPARIAGLNAFHDAGIPKMLVDIAYTSRGINVFANLTGSNYDA